MGGKQGSSSTQIEIPDWLEAEMKPFLADSLANFGKFSQKGMSVIMPEEGKMGVKVRSPWDLVPTVGDTGPVKGPPGDTGTVPVDDTKWPTEDPATKPVDNGPGGGNSGGGERGRVRRRGNKW